jgi:tetratricopeptide (TPR) repeat protein/O-antigen ligase
MEAAWLAAVSVVPLFFNVYSSRIFEPDKITILRTLALTTLAAWIIKLVEEGGIKWKSQNGDKSLFKYLIRYPLMLPVMGLVIVYIISTIFSVTPSISLLGSYQRLQGTYTTFSYLIIFFSIIVNLRKHAQINRIITTVILASLPVSAYGFLQHYNIDPIPWGGNVSVRIASTMGNSIFVAAYLIMVFPLTVGRIIESFREILKSDEESSSGIKSIKQIIRGTIYVIIAGLQLIAIYWSYSRGPLLGLLAGLYFLLLLLTIYWRKRWATIMVVGLAVIGAIGLVVFNMENGPLEALRKSPTIGRFGNLLNPESNSALVRQYIWEGTVKLVGIHDPLKFPDGSTDEFNILRPLIGYGPESMYVAFNQFYQPELGQVEKRNASPDRAHNETWDSIVTTGNLGLLVYLSIFSSVFYFGLKWQNLIETKRDKSFFFACLIGGGILGSIALIVVKGIEYLGVGLPFGMIIGVVLYLSIHALIFSPQDDAPHRKNPYSILMIVLFAAIVGHFVEINFGIAIVITRTLFWTYTGLILVLGFILPRVITSEQQVIPVAAFESRISTKSNPKKGRKSLKFRRKAEQGKRPFVGDHPDWLRQALIGAIILGIILATLGFDFITNADHSTSIISIIINSLTRLNNKGGVVSFGVLALILLTWIIGTCLYAAELDDSQDGRSWLKTLALVAGISIATGVIFWLLHSLSLAGLASFVPHTQDDVLTEVNSIGALLTKYYLYIFLTIVVLALFLLDEWPARSVSRAYLGSMIAPIALITLFTLTNITNLKEIHADITFKMAEPFTKSGQWQVATFLYKDALKLAPKEDHYYLFLGRSYLEQAKITESTSDQDSLVLQAESDLKDAQAINPLNTDHTANLARLYSWWAQQASDSATRADREQKASDYYATAVTLSPNNSTLWDEWAGLYMQVMGQASLAFDRLQHALSLDSRYSYTEGLLGDYYQMVANSTDDVTAKKQAYQSAAEYYQTAVDVFRSVDSGSKAAYLISLSNVYRALANLNSEDIDQTQIQNAIDALQNAIQADLSTNDLWKVQESIGELYYQLGDKANALQYTTQALQNAPSTYASNIQDFITKIEALP